MDNNQNDAILVAKIIGFIIMLLAVIVLLLGSFKIVQTGENGVVLRMGAVDRIMEPGFHLKIPFVEKVKSIEVREQKIEVSAAAASQDLQDVNTTIALNFKIKEDQVANLYKSVRGDYKTRLIDPAIQDAVKAATAKFNAEALITKREEVKAEILKLLSARLDTVNIEVKEVAIVDFKFSPSFSQAIEKKVTAEQEALEQKNKLEQVKYEAQQDIEKAKAVAEKTRLEVDALRLGSEAIIGKIDAEARLEAAKKWDGKLPNNFIPGSTLPILNISTK